MAFDQDAPLLAAGLRLQEAGDLPRAAALYRRALEQNPRNHRALHLLGLIARETGDRGQAATLMRRALDIAPDDPEILYNLARLFLEEHRAGEAAGLLDRALAAAPDFSQARRARGLIHLADGEPSAAADCLRRVLDLEPDNAFALTYLGWALNDLGETNQAVRAMEQAAALTPDAAEPLAALAELLLNAGDPAEAERRLAGAAAINARSPIVPFLRGRAAEALGTDAIRHYRRCLELDPDDPHGAGARLAELTGADVPERAPRKQIETMYGENARLWDKAAEGDASYRGRLLLHEALVPRLGDRNGLNILDAGCGSGRAAPLLRPHAARLTGLDLSPVMLGMARAKTLYDALIQDDLLDHLNTIKASYDLIAAAAVLIHFGNLEPVFRAAQSALAPGGLFAFTVFPDDGDAYRPTRAAYYIHGRDYIVRTARETGFTVLESLEGIHEYRDGDPVAGLALVLKRRQT